MLLDDALERHRESIAGGVPQARAVGRCFEIPIQNPEYSVPYLISRVKSNSKKRE